MEKDTRIMDDIIESDREYREYFGCVLENNPKSYCFVDKKNKNHRVWANNLNIAKKNLRKKLGVKRLPDGMRFLCCQRADEMFSLWKKTNKNKKSD